MKFRLPDTGQIKCYDKVGKEIKPQTGDDLYGQNGCFVANPSSFTKLDRNGEKLSDTALEHDTGWEDGLRMIADGNTGLVWEVKSPEPDDVNYFDDKYSWQSAQEVYTKRLNDQKYGGFDDWRIPNRDELRSIIDYSQTSPAVDKRYFPNCQISFYWCSTTYEMQPYLGWVIFFGLGSATANGKTNPRHVRAVRGGYSETFGKMVLDRFADNGDGTVTDELTGLMWQQGENNRMSWYSALKHCQNMKLAGYDDWRLPNIRELNTILDLSYKDGWWYFKDFFPAEGLEPPLLHYSSSTVFEKTYVWVTNFCFGYDGYYAPKDASFLLCRAVRDTLRHQPLAPRSERIARSSTSSDPSCSEGIARSSSSLDPRHRQIQNHETRNMQFNFPDTGQILCYDDEGNQIPAPKKGRDSPASEKFYGQDGSYKINPMSFTELREDRTPMVKDNNTGLVWEVKSPNQEDLNYKLDRYNWDGANAYVEKLNEQNYGGFSDWRLPNREELRTIVNYNDTVPAIDQRYFPNTVPDFYWSKDRKEPYDAEPKLIWGVYFAFGCSICYLKESQFFVRAVRGGYNLAFGDTSRYAFKDNGDGTVTDLNTGLMWKKDENPDMTFADALKYCQELKLGGYDDWRLPNMKELPTLLDLSFQDSTWFHKEFFPNVKTKPLGFYWSSSTFGATFGWGVNFQLGYDGYYAGKKHGCYPFRPVRNKDAQ